MGARLPGTARGRWPALRAVAAREYRAMLADRWLLALLSWWPALLLGTLAWAFSAGVPRDLPLRVVDLDHSGTSRQLVRMVDAAPAVQADAALADEAQALAAVRRGEAVGLLRVPAGFERALMTGEAATVQLFTNAQLSTAAGAIEADVQQAVAMFSAGAELQHRLAQGEPAEQARAAVEPLRPGLLTLFNTAVSYEGFLVPALGAALLHLFAMFAAVAALGRELRHGTVPQWLAAAEGDMGMALLGKLGVVLAPLLGLSGLLLAVMGGWRGFTPQGSPGLLALAYLLMVVGAAGLGLLAVGLVRSLRMGLSLAGLVASPAFSYAGVAFPLLAMPLAAQAWAVALPLTWLLRLQAAQWWMGAPPLASLPDLGALLLFAGLPWLAAPWLMRRMAEPAAWGGM